jgi:hypothetical protein
MLSDANFSRFAGKSVSAVFAGLLALLAAYSAAADDSYNWSAELVSVDESAETAVLKAMVTTHANVGELPTLAEGDRVTIIWSGMTRASGIRGITRDGGEWIGAELLDSPLRITTFGLGEDGALYVAGYSSGTVHRIVPAD